MIFLKRKTTGQIFAARGDTILSVMVSVVIVGSVIGTTYYLVNSSLRLGREAQEIGYAINAINTQTERIKAVLDVEPELIFDDSTGVLGTPPLGGFGNKFCLHLDEANSTLSEPKIEIKTIPDSACEGDQIGFPVRLAEPSVEVRYHKEWDPGLPPGSPLHNDKNRFEIKVLWTGAGGVPQERVAYYRSHPLFI